SWWMQGIRDGPDIMYRRAVELDPLSLSRYAALGDFLGKDARIDELVEVIERVKELFKGPQAARLIADLLEYTGRVDETIAWTIRARDLEPNNPDHIERLADLYAYIGDYDTALALQPTPSFGLLFRIRRYEEVIDSGEFLMIDEPDDVQVRYWLSFAYNAVGMSEKSIGLLNRSGLPDIVFEEVMRAIDLEAYMTLTNAIYSAGAFDIAHELADFWVTKSHTKNDDWWQSANMACALAILGRDDEALELFRKVKISPRIPWASFVENSVCFKKFRDDSDYLAVLQQVSERRAEVRERLPVTLARFNVTL
ncbi:MAG: hypothetical protein OES79_16150, partial [Planctomycetota bacterium]|nr:hypothetical protein [Planctomycetota bacterium]